VENFLLYDFFTQKAASTKMCLPIPTAWAASARWWSTTTSLADTQGWIRTSAGFSVKGPEGERYIIQRSLGEGLNLHADPRAFCLFRDQISGLEYIRPSQEVIEKGMFLALHAYQYHVFLDFREVLDDEWGSYRRVNEYLAGRGVPSVQNALQDLLLQPVLQPLREIINPG
jgi:hypothetical protein